MQQPTDTQKDKCQPSLLNLLVGEQWETTITIVSYCGVEYRWSQYAGSSIICLKCFFSSLCIVIAIICSLRIIWKTFKDILHQKIVLCFPNAVMLKLTCESRLLPVLLYHRAVKQTKLKSRLSDSQSTVTVWASCCHIHTGQDNNISVKHIQHLGRRVFYESTRLAFNYLQLWWVDFSSPLQRKKLGEIPSQNFPTDAIHQLDVVSIFMFLRIFLLQIQNYFRML